MAQSQCNYRHEALRVFLHLLFRQFRTICIDNKYLREKVGLSNEGTNTY